MIGWLINQPIIQKNDKFIQCLKVVDSFVSLLHGRFPRTCNLKYG